MKWSLPEGWIGAGIAESDFGTSPAIRNALTDAISTRPLTYLPPGLAAETAAACAAFLTTRHGWSVPERRVHLTADVVSTLRLVLSVFVPAGSVVVVPTPAYPPFLAVPAQTGHRLVEVPSILGADGRWRTDVDAIDAAFETHGPGLLVLCNPHNPLGQVAGVDEITRISRVIDRHGSRVFSDEIHAPLIFSNTPFVPYASVSATAAAHTVTATSISKGWNVPGLKCAQVILTSDDDLDAWVSRGLSGRSEASVLGAVASRAAYSDGDGWLDALLDRLRENRDLLASLLADRLPGVTWAQPEATYLAWLGFGRHDVGSSAAQRLAERANVATVPGETCGAGLESWVRFNFAMPSELLTESVNRVAGAVGGTVRD